MPKPSFLQAIRSTWRDKVQRFEQKRVLPMFSGIIAAVGRITSLTPREAGFRLHIDAGSLGLDDVALGDSIACNGVA